MADDDKPDLKVVSMEEARAAQRPVAPVPHPDPYDANLRMCALNASIALFAGSRDLKGFLAACRGTDRFLRTGK